MGRSGYTCVRRVFCWLNVLLWLCGCALLAAGIWLRVSYPPGSGGVGSDAGGARPPSPASAALLLSPHRAGVAADALLLGVGGVTFVVAFFGCCGAWLQWRWMLVTYFSLVIMLFLAEFLIGSLAFVYRQDIGRALAEELRTGIRYHYNASTSASGGTGEAAGEMSLADTWDKVQRQFKCCGVTTYEDWYDITAWPRERWVPESCCMPLPDSAILGPSLNGADNITATHTTHSAATNHHHASPSHHTTTMTEDHTSGAAGSDPTAPHCGRTHNPVLWYGQGCAEGVRLWLVRRLHIVGVVGLIVAFVQLFGLISSMLLFCTVRHKRAAHSYKSYSPHA